MTRRLRCRVLWLAVLLGGCGAAPPSWNVATVDTAPTTTTSTTRPAPAVATTTTPTRSVAAPAAPPRRLTAIAGNQAILVTAARYGVGTTTLTAYERAPSGWRVALGPWPAFIGHKGLAPPGAKREGDGRTPSGTYGFDFFFGVQPDPGVKFPYRRVTGPNIVWVEDSNNPHYNQWADTNQVDAGNNPDNMYDAAYNYGAVIAYNTAARTPGLGSGIFIHVSRGRPSTGCVTLPASQVVALLRWLDPAANPVIVLGVGS